MNLFLFLFVLQGIVALFLVVIVLMQKSEGGALGIGGGGGGGGGPGGFMSARGAADFLTRTTKWLAVAFVALSIALAGLAINATSGHKIEDTLDRSAPPVGSQSQNGMPQGQSAPDQASGQAAPSAPSKAPANPDPLSSVTK